MACNINLIEAKHTKKNADKGIWKTGPLSALLQIMEPY